jgi:hypothetical protein
LPGDSELRDVVVKARSTAGFISPPSNKIRKVITEASSRAQQLEDEIRRCSQNSHRFVDGCFGKKDGNIQRFERGDYVRRLKKELRTIRKKAKREAKKKARRDKHDAERQKHHEAKTGAGGEGEGEEGDTFDVGAAMLRNPIYEVDEDLSPAGAHSGVGPTGGDDGGDGGPPKARLGGGGGGAQTEVEHAEAIAARKVKEVRRQNKIGRPPHPVVCVHVCVCTCVRRECV